MKVFEDLIEELKEENLIEQTVIESGEVEARADEPDQELLQEMRSPQEDSKEFFDKNEMAFKSNEADNSSQDEKAELILPFNENDFYRRRAMEEVASLQMVERILTAVEREQANVLPKSYDDIAVSKALHDFLQVSKNPNNPDNAAAEFKLMQETESWYSALSHRDQSILPAHLRRYCETAKPALSSQALVALARFYRNSPYSESVRSKFDLVVTRLFSQETEDDQRKMVFSHDDLAQHLSELYADWSSIPLYSTDDDTELTLIALKFEDFITEGINAVEFEDLVRNDFFNRLRAFKESTGENFFAPQVTATAVNCNIKVGNRYVEMLRNEKKKNNASKLEDKYSQLLDQTISEATSKTLQLVQLLKDKTIVEEEIVEPVEVKKEPEELPKVEIKKTAPAKSEGFFSFNLFQVNRWLLGLMICTLLGTFMLYSWVEFVTPEISSKEVQTLQLDGFYFKEYLQVAKITNETLIGVANPAWFDLSGEKKQETLRNLLSVGNEKGFKSVRVLSREGKTVGYIHGDNITPAKSPKE